MLLSRPPERPDRREPGVLRSLAPSNRPLTKTPAPGGLIQMTESAAIKICWSNIRPDKPIVTDQLIILR